jgi:2-polyprenyl-6-methoxyphenol hydroxylase-like FAD-dependent oxidoreductase
MTDVIIVGGGVAGSVLAILLGRQGFRVELFEQRRLPKDKPCGEGLMPAGVAVLQRMDLVDACRWCSVLWSQVRCIDRLSRHR